MKRTAVVVVESNKGKNAVLVAIIAVLGMRWTKAVTESTTPVAVTVAALAVLTAVLIVAVR